MSYSFPNDLRKRIDCQLATGLFSTDDEVLLEAMDTLEKRQHGLQQLRQMVCEAEAEVTSGQVGAFDAKVTKQAARLRLQRDDVT